MGITEGVPGPIKEEIMKRWVLILLKVNLVVREMRTVVNYLCSI